jgi:hypothetical protein
MIRDRKGARGRLAITHNSSIPRNGRKDAIAIPEKTHATQLLRYMTSRDTRNFVTQHSFKLILGLCYLQNSTVNNDLAKCRYRCIGNR